MFKLSVSGTWSGLLASELFASARLCRPKAGDTLFHKGDTGDGCYRLDKGLLKVCLTSPKGEERIIAILRSGAIVGDLAVTDCELRFVSTYGSADAMKSHRPAHRLRRTRT
jgi:CRP/FNR family cyclic AMP-dependent transcriptional regulator